ncbi:hypothetical protein [Roseobacter sp.]|uniref:hypothetical protein n=1 Tax=Roseobacter sp. TaxID=1907202 RepID=UPI00385F7EB6
MWPDGAEKYRRGLDPTAVTYGSDSVDFNLHCMLDTITRCLECWLLGPLDYGGEYRAAALLFNPIEDPLFSNTGRCHGKGETKRVLHVFEGARRLFKRAKKIEQSKPEDAQRLREEIARSFATLQRPASIYAAKLMNESDNQFLKRADQLCEHYELCLALLREDKGNGRALRVAVRLRAIIEVHSKHEITVGTNGKGLVEGFYANFLVDVYSVLGIDVDYYRYACEAQKWPTDEKMFLECKRLLSANLTSNPVD